MTTLNLKYVGSTNITRAIVDEAIESQKLVLNDISAVLLASNVLSLDTNAFSGMVGLSSITNTSQLKHIGDYAFDGCALTGSYGYNDINYIGVAAFRGTNVQYINFKKNSNNLTIKAQAFENCQELTSVYLNDKSRTIEASTYRNCSKLSAVQNSGYAIYIGDYAFDGCALTGTLGFNATTYIGNGAFRGCKDAILKNFQETMQVGDYAFASCYNFPDKINLPACTEIGRYAFLSCQNLSNLNAPQCTFVDYNAFYGTKLWDVDSQQ